jgi:hypothetical protein
MSRMRERNCVANSMRALIRVRFGVSPAVESHGLERKTLCDNSDGESVPFNEPRSSIGLQMLVLVLLSVLAWGGAVYPRSIVLQPSPTQDSGIIPKDELGIYTVAFEDSLKNAKRSELFFLVIGEDQDPPEELFRTMSRLNLRLSKGSNALRTRGDDDQGVIYVDRKTKEQGTLIRITRLVKGKGLTSAAVKVIYHRTSENGFTEVLTLKKDGDRWLITGRSDHGEY